MKQGDRRYTVTMNRAGQERPYGDTIHDFTLSVEWIPYKKRAEGEEMKWEPNDLNETLIFQVAKAAGFSWVEKGEGDWTSPHLKSKSKEGPGVWRFIVTETYTD
jgi:hypothetical protein